MLYGHIEEPRHRVDHVLRLRELQDETGGFAVFIPLRYQHDFVDSADGMIRNRLQARTTMASPAESLKTFAVSRLLFDNVPHVKCFWVMHGLSLAQLSLNFGVDDLDGSVVEYKITHDADSYGTPNTMHREDLLNLIWDAGFRPVERNTRYEVVREYDAPPSRWPSAAPSRSRSGRDGCLGISTANQTACRAPSPGAMPRAGGQPGRTVRRRAGLAGASAVSRWPLIDGLLALIGLGSFGAGLRLAGRDPARVCSSSTTSAPGAGTGSGSSSGSSPPRRRSALGLIAAGAGAVAAAAARPGAIGALVAAVVYALRVVCRYPVADRTDGAEMEPVAESRTEVRARPRRHLRRACAVPAPAAARGHEPAAQADDRPGRVGRRCRSSCCAAGATRWPTRCRATRDGGPAEKERLRSALAGDDEPAEAAPRESTKRHSAPSSQLTKQFVAVPVSGDSDKL